MAPAPHPQSGHGPPPPPVVPTHSSQTNPPLLRTPLPRRDLHLHGRRVILSCGLHRISRTPAGGRLHVDEKTFQRKENLRALRWQLRPVSAKYLCPPDLRLCKETALRRLSGYARTKKIRLRYRHYRPHPRNAHPVCQWQNLPRLRCLPRALMASPSILPTGFLPLYPGNSTDWEENLRKNCEAQKTVFTRQLQAIIHLLHFLVEQHCSFLQAFPGSSMVEQGAVNAKVAGSSPARGAILSNNFLAYRKRLLVRKIVD